MIIKNAEFISSFANGKVNAFDLSEIAVVGRSNVGKSSFINKLANNSKLAKTSSVPGKTRLINVFKFLCDKFNFALIDLPGYGYAKVSQTEQAKWEVFIEDYLKNSNNLKHVFLLVDIRHEPSSKDFQMMQWLYFYNRSVTVIATKADKLSKAQANNAKIKIASGLKIGKENVIVFSSETGVGFNEVLTRINQFVGGGV